MDIVERLRVFIQFEDRDDYQNHVVWKAADEIELLRKERDGLREALDDMIQFVRKEYGSNDVKVQAAEAVLKGKENDGI